VRSGRRNKIKAGRNNFKIQRNKIIIYRNKNQIRRNEIQMPLAAAYPGTINGLSSIPTTMALLIGHLASVRVRQVAGFDPANQ
jgi:hypothetical protein